VGQRRLGQEVVGQPVREPGQGVGGQRRDDQEICALQVRVRITARLRPREGMERLRGDEALRPAREQRLHIVSRLDEQPDELAGLVGRDAAGDADEDPRHAHIVPPESNQEAARAAVEDAAQPRNAAGFRGLARRGSAKERIRDCASSYL
jgi:hypothetical protein